MEGGVADSEIRLTDMWLAKAAGLSFSLAMWSSSRCELMVGCSDTSPLSNFSWLCPEKTYYFSFMKKLEANKTDEAAGWSLLTLGNFDLCHGSPVITQSANIFLKNRILLSDRLQSVRVAIKYLNLYFY